MRQVVRIARPVLVTAIISTFVLAVGELKLPTELPGVAGQAPILLPGQTSPNDVDMTPAEQSSEVQALLMGTSFAPDPGEPAGAIVAHFATQERIRKAGRRVEDGPLPGEIDFDPYQLLNETVAMRQRTTVLYPTSRHAWQDLGDLLWQQYTRQHRSSDLRQAVDAYTKAADLLTTSVRQNVGGVAGRDFQAMLRWVARGYAALSDTKSLDSFFAKLRDPAIWPVARFEYAVALGSLSDPRADKLFQEELQSVPPRETLPAYVNYLWDQGRYQSALQILDRRDGTKLDVILHAERGAILERLGRLDEARAEYKYYFDEATRLSQSRWSWPLAVSDRYRIAGSALQQGIKFHPSLERLPKPESQLWRGLKPLSAWATHVPTPSCDSADWGCRASEYILLAIHGETGCISTSSTCRGTVGGMWAVAWNMRNRVFYGRGIRNCPQTETCFNYASTTPLGNPPNPADTVLLSKRYYFVVDQGYDGVTLPMNDADRQEADQHGREALVYGNVPDPNAGRCFAGSLNGDPCLFGCSAQAGYWDSYNPPASVEFRGGQVVWQNAQNSTCQWQQLVPIGGPSGSRCGKECFTPSLTSGATCPRFGWLNMTYSCGGESQPTYGPVYGNFYWRMKIGGAADQATWGGDGDSKSDIAVYRPGTGEWFIQRSTTGGSTYVQWGCGPCGDIPVAADYDGDGFSDVAVYRAGEWAIRQSSDIATVDINWGCGSCGDVPVPADYDGDRRADIAVYRTTTAQWFILRSSDGGLTQVNWGCVSCGDIAVPADYDGDGRADIGVYRPSTGEWFILRSSDGGLINPVLGGCVSCGDKPVAADYDGDGRVDVAVYRPSTAQWFILGSSQGSSSVVWGSTGQADRPVKFIGR